MAKPSLAYIVIFLFAFQEEHEKQPTIYHHTILTILLLLTKGHFQLLKRCRLLKEGSGDSMQNTSTLADIATQAMYS